MGNVTPCSRTLLVTLFRCYLLSLTATRTFKVWTTLWKRQTHILSGYILSTSPLHTLVCVLPCMVVTKVGDILVIIFSFLFTCRYLSNRQQFSMFCTLIDHRNGVKMFKTQAVPLAAGEWFTAKWFLYAISTSPIMHIIFPQPLLFIFPGHYSRPKRNCTTTNSFNTF